MILKVMDSENIFFRFALISVSMVVSSREEVFKGWPEKGGVR